MVHPQEAKIVLQTISLSTRLTRFEITDVFLVSARHKFMMGWSAKCGCSSVKFWYLDLHQIPTSELGMPLYKAIGFGNTLYTKVRWRDRNLYHEYRKYVVVRSPYSRVVSGFVNKYVTAKEYPIRGWRTFAEFLNTLQKDRKFKLVDKHHFTPQFSEAYNDFKTAGFAFDKVVELENLALELTTIGKTLGEGNIQVRTANKTKFATSFDSKIDAANLSLSELEKIQIPPYQYFYNPETINLVSRIYKRVFDALAELGIHYGPPSVERSHFGNQVATGAFWQED